jgi:hypothetical protein
MQPQHAFVALKRTFALVVAVHIITPLWRGKVLQALCLYRRLCKLLQHLQEEAPRRGAIDV